MLLTGGQLRRRADRSAAPDCCKWCERLAGTYDYEKVKNTGNDVFCRHQNCGCSVDYVTDGRRQDVWSIKLWEPDADTLAERREHDRNTDRA